MLTILGALIGLAGSAIPDILGIFSKKADQAHELAVAQARSDANAKGHEFKMAEIDARADIGELEAVHKEFAARRATWKWIEALISSVRPVLTYGFFGLYAWVKVSQVLLAMSALGGDISLAVTAAWHPEDQAIFATIISFWFGGRALQKFRKKQ